MSQLRGRELAVFMRAGLDQDEAAALRGQRIAASRESACSDGDLLEICRRAATREQSYDQPWWALTVLAFRAQVLCAPRDPARVLRDVTAGRAILAAYEDALDAERDYLPSDGSGTIALERAWLETVCQHLAGAYEDGA